MCWGSMVGYYVGLVCWGSMEVEGGPGYARRMLAKWVQWVTNQENKSESCLPWILCQKHNPTLNVKFPQR